jgi:hypothetical protein
MKYHIGDNVKITNHISLAGQGIEPGMQCKVIKVYKHSPRGAYYGIKTSSGIGLAVYDCEIELVKRGDKNGQGKKG